MRGLSEKLAAAGACCALFVALPVVAFAGDEAFGFLEVRSDDHVGVKVDGKYRGLIGGDGVLVARDLSPGVHHVHAWKNGFEDQQTIVLVEAGATTIERLRPWQPLAVHRIPGALAKGGASHPSKRALKTGAVIVEAVPAQATADSLKLGWKKIPMDERGFLARNIAPGDYKMTFCNDVKCIDYHADVRADRVLALVIDFEPGDILDVSNQRLERWSKLHDVCAKSADRPACVEACRIDLALEPDRASAACKSLTSESKQEMLAEKKSDPRSPSGAPARPSEGPINVAATIDMPCAPTAGEPPGFVVIKTDPGAELWAGNEKLGQTPLRVRLPAGCIELRAVNKDRGVEKTFRVEVDPVETRQYKIAL